MDIARRDQSRQKRIRRGIYGAIAVIVVAAITLGVSRLKPVAPGVDRGTVLVNTVKRGSMVVDVRGQGTLVPEDIGWLPATTQGRVERIRLRPGVTVDTTSVILDLSNPQLDQELRDAELKSTGAEASLANLRVQSQNDALAQEAATANIETDYKKALVPKLELVGLPGVNHATSVPPAATIVAFLDATRVLIDGQQKFVPR